VSGGKIQSGVLDPLKNRRGRATATPSPRPRRNATTLRARRLGPPSITTIFNFEVVGRQDSSAFLARQHVSERHNLAAKQAVIRNNHARPSSLKRFKRDQLE
jgi:hypothetical protein